MEHQTGHGASIGLFGGRGEKKRTVLGTIMILEEKEGGGKRIGKTSYYIIIIYYSYYSSEAYPLPSPPPLLAPQHAPKKKESRPKVNCIMGKRYLFRIPGPQSTSGV